MLKYKVGDLIEAARSGEVNVIAQQCNCFNTRKRGIAPLLDKAFPEVGIIDDLTTKGDHKKFGGFSYAYCARYDLSIYNLYGQWGWWKRKDGQPNTDIEKLSSALSCMADHIESLRYQDINIGLPLIGCGLGGGDWGSISNIIESTLVKKGLNVTIYTLEDINLG